MNPQHRAWDAFAALSSRLDEFQADCARRCPPDQLRVIDSNFARMVVTIERLGVQLGNVLRLAEGCTPAGSNVRQFNPRRRRH